MIYITDPQLDHMCLVELLDEFDRRCALAKAAGLWLYQHDPHFATYAQARIHFESIHAVA